MKAIPSSKIEVIFNYDAPKQSDNGKLMPTPVERIVLVDGEEIYRDKQMPFLYVRDKSILRQFENWTNEYYSKSKQAQCCCKVCRNGQNRTCFFSKLWLKLFGKRFKLKT